MAWVWTKEIANSKERPLTSLMKGNGGVAETNEKRKADAQKLLDANNAKEGVTRLGLGKRRFDYPEGWGWSSVALWKRCHSDMVSGGDSRQRQTKEKMKKQTGPKTKREAKKSSENNFSAKKRVQPLLTSASARRSQREKDFIV